MKLLSMIIILVSLAFVAYVSVALTIWSGEYKDLFFYLDDWTSWVMAFVLIIAITSVLKWLLKWEVHVLK